MNVYRALRRGTIVKSALGREPFYWLARDPGVVELGSRDCEWAIDLTRVTADTHMVSFGLGEDVSFETELIAAHGCSVRGFDPTPRAVRHVADNVKDARFQAFACALADRDGTLRLLFPPDRLNASSVAQYVGAEDTAIDVPCLTLQSVRQRYQLPRIDVLKLDIEGAEYAVIAQALANHWIDDVDQVLVEFHHFLPGLSPEQTHTAIRQLQDAGFQIAWIGRTNHEYLFTRRR